jgi:histidyl-tRNA synthetase
MNENRKLTKVQPKTLAGFMELLPQEQILFNQMQETIKNSYEKFGFLPLDTPIIEAADVLLAKTGGDTAKQIYTLTKGDTDLALRFDLTVPLAKYIALHQDDLSFPFKRYQIGKVYRGERPQQGRFREFYQADIDIIGDGKLNLMHDAEIPSVIDSTFKDLGLGDYTIKMNNRKILNGLFGQFGLADKVTEILRIIDKKDKIGDEAVIRELIENGLERKNVDIVMQFISIDGTKEQVLEKLKTFKIDNDQFNIGVKELEEVTKGVKQFGVDDKNVALDLTIARGLDYYTGTVYETQLDNHKNIGSVCSGGRYDNLSEFYTDRQMPGVGISIGLTRLFDQLSRANALKSIDKKSISDVLVIPMTENIGECMKAASILRGQGINTELFLEDKKTKQKFAYADRLQVPYSLIIGDNEIESSKYTLRNMQSREQSMLAMEEIVNAIKQPKIQATTAHHRHEK